MMKTQIGLGVLSIPAAFNSLGIVPGVICLCMIAAITTWSDYMVGVFKMRHPTVYGLEDAGGLMFGPVGRNFLAGAFCLCKFYINGYAASPFRRSVNLTIHRLGVCWRLRHAQHLDRIEHTFHTRRMYSRLCGRSGNRGLFAFKYTDSRSPHICCMDRPSVYTHCKCVCRFPISFYEAHYWQFSKVFTVTIAVGVEDRPATAPQDGIWMSDYKIINSPTFTEGISAVSSLVFAYAGTPAFFSIVSEMRDPRHYTRALLICQGVVTATYLSIGCVVYYYCGSYVASPALGSAGQTVKKVSYGFALPGLIVTTTLVTHVSDTIGFAETLSPNACSYRCPLKRFLSAYYVVAGIWHPAPLYIGLPGSAPPLESRWRLTLLPVLFLCSVVLYLS